MNARGPRPLPLPLPMREQRAIVLPVVLVLLLVVGLVGLFAARRAATVEEISNNTRVNQVATLAAENGLRHCEALVMDAAAEGNRFDNALKDRIETTTLLDGPGDARALWSQVGSWAAGSAHLVTVEPDAAASPTLTGVPTLFCLAESMQGDQFLITARGLSAGASFNADGQLQSGAEVWLQSILRPNAPVHTAPTP
jgi:type IV pilus assembly protein PilX